MKSVSFCRVECDRLFLIPLFHESDSDNLINKADERKGENNRKVVSVNHKQGHTKQVLLVIAAIIIKIRKYFRNYDVKTS